MKSYITALFATLLVTQSPVFAINVTADPDDCVKLTIAQPVADKSGAPSPESVVDTDGTAKVKITVSLEGECLSAEGDVFAFPEEGTGTEKSLHYILSVPGKPKQDLEFTFNRTDIAASKKWNFWIKPKDSALVDINKFIEFTKKCGSCGCTTYVTQGCFLAELPMI